MTDIKKMSLSELGDLRNEIDARINELANKRRQELLKELEELDRQAGQESPIRIVVKKGSKPKYASRDGKTWTGNGPAPSWVREYEATGKSREDLRVK